MLISNHAIICTLLCWLVISDRQNSRIQSANDNWITWYLLFKQWSLELWINGLHYSKSISFSLPLYISPGNMLRPFTYGSWEPAEIHLQNPKLSRSPPALMLQFHVPSRVSKSHWCSLGLQDLRDYVDSFHRGDGDTPWYDSCQGHTGVSGSHSNLRVGKTYPSFVPLM